MAEERTDSEQQRTHRPLMTCDFLIKDSYIILKIFTHFQLKNKYLDEFGVLREL